MSAFTVPILIPIIYAVIKYKVVALTVPAVTKPAYWAAVTVAILLVPNVSCELTCTPVAPATTAQAASTYAVVANLVELFNGVWVVPVVPVGNDGVPVNVGEANGA